MCFGKKSKILGLLGLCWDSAGIYVPASTRDQHPSKNGTPVDGFKLTFLNSDDVFLVNSGEHVYCWIGIGASVEERKNGMTYANDYVSATETPWLPISVLAEGKESVEFFECFQG